MYISVLVEPVPGKGYRARGGEPFAFTAEGESRDEAVRRLRELIQNRLQNGAQLIQVEITSSEPPYARFAGTWKPDDPFIEEWKQAMEEYRSQVDENLEMP